MSALRDRMNWYLSGEYMREYSEEDLRVLNAWLDPQLEAALGYRLFPSRAEAMTAYDHASRCVEGALAFHGSCGALRELWHSALSARPAEPGSL
mmetsp:Transcript_75886/g.203282  ORF Transcript_75886/g.203282 Transcript_75886/m.203282 type:complete len:94 (-) Transcript_75886:528-809(-)